MTSPTRSSTPPPPCLPPRATPLQRRGDRRAQRVRAHDDLPPLRGPRPDPARPLAREVRRFFTASTTPSPTSSRSPTGWSRASSPACAPSTPRPCRPARHRAGVAQLLAGHGDHLLRWRARSWSAVRARQTPPPPAPMPLPSSLVRLRVVVPGRPGLGDAPRRRRPSPIRPPRHPLCIALTLCVPMTIRRAGLAGVPVGGRRLAHHHDRAERGAAAAHAPSHRRGVQQHSDFFDDPFNRLYRSFPRIWATILTDAAEGQTRARAIRDVHRDDPRRRRRRAPYRALDPATFWWAHATFTWGIIDAHDQFDPRPPSPRRREAFTGLGALVASATA